MHVDFQKRLQRTITFDRLAFAPCCLKTQLIDRKVPVWLETGMQSYEQDAIYNCPCHWGTLLHPYYNSGDREDIRCRWIISTNRRCPPCSLCLCLLRDVSMAMSVVQTPQRIHYPSSDGQPVAESDFQLHPLLYAVTTLRTHFQERADVYVAGNMFIYYEEGNPEAVVAPD